MSPALRSRETQITDRLVREGGNAKRHISEKILLLLNMDKVHSLSTGGRKKGGRTCIDYYSHVARRQWGKTESCGGFFPRRCFSMCFTNNRILKTNCFCSHYCTATIEVWSDFMLAFAIVAGFYILVLLLLLYPPRGPKEPVFALSISRHKGARLLSCFLVALVFQFSPLSSSLPWSVRMCVSRSLCPPPPPSRQLVVLLLPPSP